LSLPGIETLFVDHPARSQSLFRLTYPEVQPTAFESLYRVNEKCKAKLTESETAPQYKKKSYYYRLSEVRPLTIEENVKK
jgi:hypothetical protein